MCVDHVNCNDFHFTIKFIFKNNILCIPRTSLREALIKTLHRNGLAGHFVIDKTYQLLNERYYWPQLLRDATKFVKHCFTCQGTTTKYEPLHPTTYSLRYLERFFHGQHSTSSKNAKGV